MLLTIITLVNVWGVHTTAITSLDGVGSCNGYVSYKRTLADVACYQTSSVNVKFVDDGVIAYDECESAFDVVVKEMNLVMVDYTVKYLLRSNMLMRFIRVARDDEWSIAFAYMKSVFGEVECVFDNDNNKGETMLTEVGRSKWNGGMNKKFFKECGDFVIRKYDVGIALVYVYKLSFESKYMKDVFVKRYNSDNDKIGKFDIFIKGIESKLRKYKIYGHSNNNNTIKLKLYVFQLGGDVTPLIASAMNDNSFLISTYIYTHNNTFISYNSNSDNNINQLAYYFEHSFPQQLKAKINVVPVEHYSVQQVQDYLHYMDIDIQLQTYSDVVNSNYIAQRRLLNLVDHLDYVYEKMKYIYEYFPIRTNEIETMYNTLKHYYDYVTIDGNGITCFEKENSTECVKDLIFSYNELNYREYIISLYDFIKEFHNEITYTIQLHGDMCLPKGMSWSVDIVFKLHKYKTFYYMRCNDSTFHCHYKASNVFTCSDGVISIDFAYDNDNDNESEVCYITCTNGYYTTKQSVYTTKCSSGSEFGFNVPPIDF